MKTVESTQHLHAHQVEHSNNQEDITSWFWSMYNTNDDWKSFDADAIFKAIAKYPLILNFQNTIGYHFQDPKLLIRALSHRSFIHEINDSEFRSYEGLEFLGDSFLNYFVTYKLQNSLPDLDEGRWSKLRGAIVNTESLYDLGQSLEISKIILTGRGYAATRSKSLRKVDADVIEAVVGAVIQDSSEDKKILSGEREAFKVLENLFNFAQADTGKIFWDESLLKGFDYKSQLQEIVMKKLKTTPVYTSLVLEDEEGYLVKCFVGETLLGSLSNESKKNAQKLLAKKIFNKIQNEDNFLEIITKDIKE